MGWFNFSKKGVVGIDIGTASIKVVELIRDKGRFTLRNYGVFELHSGAGAVNVTSPKERAQTSHLSNKDIVWTLKEVLKKTGIKSKDVVVSIPSSNTFTTVVSMPYLSEEDLARSIQYEARKYIPVPLEEVQIDWSVINAKGVKKEAVPKTPEPASEAPASEELVPEKTPMVEVLLAAVPREDIARYKTIMAEAGLKLKGLEIESFALTRGLIGNDLSPMCIVSIGGRSTSIFVVDNGFQRISHDYGVGGYEVTRIIAKSLGISLDRAEELQKSFGIRKSEDNVIRQAMVSLLDMMVFETKKTITHYEDLKKKKIGKIFLVGGLVNMPEFVTYFNEKLGRTAELGNPLGRIITPAGLDKIKSELNTTFAVAIGLAMKEIK
ncbi:MAG: pilus assembly protein PilM [Parcubacteria group bacterium]